VLSRLRPRWSALRSVPITANLDGIPVTYPRYPALPRLLLFSYSGRLCHLGIAATAERIRREFDFDLVHAHTVLPDGFAAMLLNRRRGKPLVISVHGYDAVQLNRGRLRRRQIIRAMESADRIVCVSGKLMRECLAHCPRPDKFRIIHNGFRINQAAAASGSGTAHPVVLSVGHLIPLKGHECVLEAVAALSREIPTLRYRIIGDGYLRPRLEARARELGVAEAVEFLGRLPREEVMAHYAACDIFVLPSSPEGFGIVYLEAMAYGKPIIACQGEGISEIVEDGQTAVLVPPHDSAAVASAIRALLADPERAAWIGAAGHEVALQYTWRRNAERLLAVYEEVAGTRRASKKSNNGANE